MRVLDKRRLLASTIAILAVLAVFQTFPSRVEGASTGTVCIAQVTDTKCPGSPPIFNGPLTTPNTLLRVPVIINNTSPFNGFDITLNSSSVSKLRPYGVDQAGSIMPAGSITLVECVGGVLILGAFCSSTDNPTTVRLAVVTPFGFLFSPGTTGLLFTAIFSIAGTTLPGGETIGYQNGCPSSTSSSGTLCLSLSNGTITPVPESTQTGGFDNSATATLPYATVSTTTTNLGQSLAGAPTHALPTVTFTATSQNGFNTTSTASLNLAATFNGTGARPTVSLSTSFVDLTGVPLQVFTQAGSVTSTVPAGVYFATMTATYQTQDMITFTTSSLSATFSLPLSVTDYTVSASPNPVPVLPPSSQPVTVTIAPKAGFFTLVKLGVTIPAATASAGIGATYSSSTISGGSGTSTLTITTTASTPVGTYTLTVTSNSTLNGFTKTHSTTLALTVGPPGFQITASPATLVFTPGNTGKSTVIVAAVNGFAGVVDLSFTVTPSSGLICSLSPTVIALNFTASVTSALSCTGSVGTYNIVVTGSGAGQSHSASVSFTVQANTQGTIISVDPYATIDLSRASKTITVTVNLTSSPPINGFSVILAYDYHVLHASSLNYSTNVFAQSPYSQIIVSNCLDDIPPPGSLGLCSSNDGLGITSFAMTVLGGTTLNNTSGSLFTVTFNVDTTAPVFSQIQVKSAVLSNGQIDPLTGKPYIIPVSTFDGYYTSLSCNGTPCPPPKVDFNWSPITPASNQVVTFNANATFPNPGATVADYIWNWGASSCNGCSPLTDSGTSNIAYHNFVLTGTYPVSLTVTWGNGVKLSTTRLLTVANSGGFEILGPQIVIVAPGTESSPYSFLVQSFDLNGTVTLQAQSPPGLTVSLESSALKLVPNSFAFDFVTVSVSSSVPPGTYVYTITGTSGSISHTIEREVLVPDFVIQTTPASAQVFGGTSVTLDVSTARSPGFVPTRPPVNITISVEISPSTPNGPTVSIRDTLIILYGIGDTLVTIQTGPNTPPGNYTVTVTGTGTSSAHSAFSTITVFPPPILKVMPSGGPVGTKVQIRGSGFFFTSQNGYRPQNQQIWITFDDQFLGEAFTSSSSFTFTFNVPDAQAGAHSVKALQLLAGVNATVAFEVLATPNTLDVKIETGSIYFPGDTATVYVLVSQNGALTQAGSIQLRLTLIKPDGSNITLSVVVVSPGLFKAVYTIPTTGSIGTYAILAAGQGPNSFKGSDLGSFEVKPSWLSSNGRNLALASVSIGAVGMIGFAWKKGYFKRKQDDEILA